MSLRALSRAGFRLASAQSFSSNAYAINCASDLQEPYKSLFADRRREPWYKDGLSFRCTACGACCRQKVPHRAGMTCVAPCAALPITGASGDKYLQACTWYDIDRVP
jgi:hypothetical protein